jgi:hypothetical protein
MLLHSLVGNGHTPTNPLQISVISPSVPPGYAIVADWTQVILFVRESMSLVLNMYGDNEFSTNTFLVRAEMRCVAEFVRPQAFAICSIYAGS